jgi:hypothetical protein
MKLHFFAGVFACLLVLSCAAAAQEAVSNSSEAGQPDFRIEKVPVDGGAELITIFARTGPAASAAGDEMPLVTVLRDTLGDDRTENDQLRYLWMLTYTRPSAGQRIASFVPFLYSRVGNNTDPGSGPPSAVIDVRRSDKALWQAVTWMVAKRLLLSELGMGKASVLQYRQNRSDYRRSAIARALSVLSLYESVNGEKVLTDSEMKDIQSRLWLTNKPFGWHVSDENLERVYNKQVAIDRDLRGHNWELLRQYSEAQGLYFEPLTMPDGIARHAIVWTSAEDLQANRGRKFEGRFLNIKDPWSDSKLLKWKGYTQTRWYDADGRVVEEGTEGAVSRTMIPLAVYGLDFPKIPMLLVDFRNTDNPKRREMSRRVLHDVTSNLLSISQFSSIPYFLGRYVYDYVTDKRGMDLNQASRVRSYAQLKTLLSLDESLNDGFRDEISRRLEHVSLNPLENDVEAEARLARKQYENLLAWAKRPDGLPAKLDRERRRDMVELAHGRKDRILFNIAHVLSFGTYTHREEATPQLTAALDTRRQLRSHERYLREVAGRSAKPEVDSDVAAIKRSLMFISENGAGAETKTTRALARIFSTTQDEDMRSLCVTSLYRINNSDAKKQLLAIYINSNLPQRWRNMSAHYLKQALSEGQQMTVRDAEVVAGIATN